MNIQAFKDIESIDFTARVNIASDLRTFMSAVAAEESVKLVLDDMHQDANIDYVIKRMQYFRDSDFDEDYANPRDTAMAVYGWLIVQAKPELTQLINTLLQSLRNTWWTMQLSAFFQSELKAFQPTQQTSQTVLYYTGGGRIRTSIGHRTKGAVLSIKGAAFQKISPPQRFSADSGLLRTYSVYGYWEPEVSYGRTSFSSTRKGFDALEQFPNWTESMLDSYTQQESFRTMQ